MLCVCRCALQAIPTVVVPASLTPPPAPRVLENGMVVTIDEDGDEVTHMPIHQVHSLSVVVLS